MQINYDFSNKTAVVIGATAGIGRSTARLFAENGANVVIAGLGADEGRAIETQINQQSPGKALFIETDVTRESDIQTLMQRATQRFGRIHMAVNNAGIEGKFGPVHETSVEEFERIININLRGVFLGVKHQIAHMLANGGGSIVNTSSSAGVTGIANVAIYTASKHGVVGLTKAAALEVAKANIRVNAIAPGPVDTGLLHRMIGGNMDVSVIANMVPMGRVSSADEIAPAIVWLCSDAASFVTGHTLVIDGGLTVP